MKPKIIFIHLCNNFSGSPRVLKDTIESLPLEQNYLLLTSKGPGFLSNLQNSVFFNYTWSKNKGLTLVRFIYAQLYIFFYILLFTKKNDTIFINTMQPSIAAIAAKIRNKHVIFHIHETHTSQFFFGRFYNLIRKNIKSKDIFVSEYIASLESFDHKSSAVIHNSISNEFVLSAQKHTYNHLIDDIFNVLMICSLRDYKGIPEFIELCYSLQLNRQIHFTLVLDATKDEINEYFRGIFISDNLTIHERTKNLSQFYEKTSLLLNLSRPDQWIETFGLTIIEAMSFGIPCIVPTIGGPTEIIDDNLNGFHIACYNTRAIKLKIEELAKDAIRCKILSVNAKEKSIMFTPSIYKMKMNNLVYESQ